MTDIKTIRDAIDAFRHFLEDRTGRVHRQIAYPPKLIYYYLNMYSNVFSAEYARVRGGSDPNVVLTIPCVSFREIDQVECPCAPKKGCSFYKSDYPIPDMVNGHPLSVTTVDGFISYDYLEWFNFKDKLNSRLLPDTVAPYYTIKTIENNRHLYLYSSEKVQNPKAASITAMFYDPLEVAYFPVCDQFKPFCNPLDETFVISKDVQTKVFEATLIALNNARSITTTSDLLNNDSNDAQSQTPR